MLTTVNKNFWIIEQVESRGNRSFIVSSSQELSFKLFYDYSVSYSQFLKKSGLSKADHVGIYCNNTIDFLIIVQSLWFINAIPVPINVRLNKKEIENQIRASDCKYIINCSKIEQSFNFDRVAEITHDTIHYQEFSESINFDYNASSIALMMFTSGSTGTPKCVRLSFNNLYESALSCDSFLNHSIDDMWIASLPFYHIGGFSIFTRTVIFGCKLVLPESLKIQDITESIKKFRPTIISLVPTMFESIVSEFKTPWDELRNMFIGGGPMSEKLFDKSIELGWPVSTVYGSTETSSMVTLASTENLRKNGLSAGKPLKGVEILFEEAEVYSKIKISSKSIAEGYYNFHSDLKNQIIKGTYLSNDLGSLDKNGNLQIHGRDDEIIISGGENISLNEIEKILNNCEELRNSVALGIKDEKWGQSYIIVSDSQSAKLEERIKSVLDGSIGRFKFPSSIHKIKKIPRSPLGKILKDEIKEKYKFNFL